MWNMLTAWTIQLRTALARVHLAMLVGSLLAPAPPMGPTETLMVVQHQPWRWHPLEPSARMRPTETGGSTESKRFLRHSGGTEGSAFRRTITLAQ